MKGLRQNIHDAMYTKLPTNYDWETVTKTTTENEYLLADKEVDAVAYINNILYCIRIDTICEQHKE